MGLVLLRMGVTHDAPELIQVWGNVSPETHDQLKVATINLITTQKSPVLSRQSCDLASEIAETIFVKTKTLWEELLSAAFELVQKPEKEPMKAVPEHLQLPVQPSVE